ncbi:hypothetical protein PC129_g11600 [Phytophthora cactorum]|uniref:Uncharacterized protein n=1 Tax=Phytophthora cactorum TaxID=29920 RepID=A0A8T1C6J1_9STRA|nr:hypothetical protein Pcac1_g18287 [Phytophthora cactorum]KAG2820127.1 hypothetical protein PC111_g11588 [Phytophthora cactorum]KAG2844192.1 hypothetical protein PC112_g2286 [Phytophthora cactorum]KAG2899631.1 hypothetical protein PC114_g13849 [Phytophthora cactorum]KAG2913547.1 hypothetical protein PC115_g11975 [Phytophthora cactorum]
MCVWSLWIATPLDPDALERNKKVVGAEAAVVAEQLVLSVLV